MPSTPVDSSRPRPVVLLLGSGDFGRELVIAHQQLGAHVVAADGYPGAPAHGVADEAVVVQLTDPDALGALLERVAPDFVVPATEAVAVDPLVHAADDVQVVPSARSARLALDREGLRRLAADELGLPTAPFWFAGSAAELTAIAEHAGLPLVVKPMMAVPGEGQSVLLRPEDVEPAWQRAVAAGGQFAHHRVLAETVVEIDHEVTLLAVRTDTDGPLRFFDPIGHRHVTGGTGETVLESWQPQPLSPTAAETARSVAARIVGALGGRGVFAVELLIRGDEVYFSDVSAIPSDAALVTLRSQRLSQFDLHARATLGLPVDALMISPAAAEVRYLVPEATGAEASGADATPTTSALGAALAVPETDVWVGSAGAGNGPARRRAAVALATAPDVPTARDRVRQATAALGKANR